MTSSASSVRAELEGYLAGRVSVQHVVAVVAAEYYKRGAGSGEWLRPVMDVIERAHPGIVELKGTVGGSGFSVRLQERPFPKQFEGPLRAAAERALGTGRDHSPLPTPGLFTRIIRAIRRVFSA
jgi:hypothetical protein